MAGLRCRTGRSRARGSPSAVVPANRMSARRWLDRDEIGDGHDDDIVASDASLRGPADGDVLGVNTWSNVSLNTPMIVSAVWRLVLPAKKRVAVLRLQPLARASPSIESN